jgi:hypothetical protein
MAEERGEFPFDPMLGAKLFGEIQAEGLRAAGALVERLVHLVDGPQVAPADDAEAESPGVDLSAVLPWFELWGDLLERTSDAFQRWQAAGQSRIDIDGSLDPAHPLAIALDGEGLGRAEMWLHNGTTEDQGELVPQCGPLSDGYGTVLECEVDIDPPKIDQLHTRSSRGFVISITTRTPAAPGTYRGIVQVRGAERVWMPIEVIVDAPTS